MPKYTSKPVTIEAVQFTNAMNALNVVSLAGSNFNLLDKEDQEDGAIAEVFESHSATWIPVKLNDWIIKGTKGEFYPCDPEVFKDKYEASGKSPSRK